MYSQIVPTERGCVCLAGVFSKLKSMLFPGLTNTLASGCSSSGWCNPSSSCGSCTFNSFSVKSNNDVVVYAQTAYT